MIKLRNHSLLEVSLIGLLVLALGLVLSACYKQASAGEFYARGFGGAQIAPSQELRRDETRQIKIEEPDEEEEESEIQAFDYDEEPEPPMDVFEARNFTEALDTDTDLGFRTGGSFGYDFSYGLRVEVEQSIGYNELDGDDLFSPALFVNGYYDLATGTRFTPYAGGGLGPMALIYDGDSEITGAAQVTVGVNVDAPELAEGLSFDVGARYLRTLPVDFGSAELPDGYQAVVAEVGVRYSW